MTLHTRLYDGITKKYRDFMHRKQRLKLPMSKAAFPMGVCAGINRTSTRAEPPPPVSTASTPLKPQGKPEAFKPGPALIAGYKVAVAVCFTMRLSVVIVRRLHQCLSDEITSPARL